jgi:hypothetical protein
MKGAGYTVMAILQALFMALSRRAGQLVNTLFGWATQLLFGKVSRDKQLFLSGMALGSIAWLISVLGIALPEVGTFLLAFIPLPEGIDQNWIRLLMLFIAAALPLIVGGLGVMALSPEDQPKTVLERVKAVLRGYPYTFGLSITLLLMIAFAPFMMLPLMAKRWTTDHVPLIVEANEYEILVAELEETLAAGGWKTVRQPVSWMVRLPTQILVSLAGTLVDRFVVEELTMLQSEKLTVTVHPADLVLNGSKFEVVRVRALLTERLAFSRANQTWTKEANDLENRVTALWQQLHAQQISPLAARQQLKQMEQERNRLNMEFEEWEILERQQLLVERSLLDATAAAEPGETVVPSMPHEKEADAKPVSRVEETTHKPRAGKFDFLLGATVLSGLVLLGWFGSKHREEPTVS